LLLGLAVLFSSHELFLKTDSYFLDARQTAELYLYNGTFNKSENTITRDRILKAGVKGPGYDYSPQAADYYDKDKITYLRFTTGDEGTYVAGISTAARNLDLTSDEFQEYLEHEGLDRMVREREGKGLSNQDVTEKYSKHVKAILQVGENTTEEFSEELGYPIEFVPLQNPYELSVGDMIDFKLIYKGKALANSVVHFGTDTQEGQPTKVNASITDEDGEFSFELTRSGHWYVGAIHMVESDEAGIDYESNWATITFEAQ
ncbi:MAG: DUF4198 domain-containing protein, partial [Flavobacteriaceae bacterium]